MQTARICSDSNEKGANPENDGVANCSISNLDLRIKWVHVMLLVRVLSRTFYLKTQSREEQMI